MSGQILLSGVSAMNWPSFAERLKVCVASVKGLETGGSKKVPIIVQGGFLADPLKS